MIRAITLACAIVGLAACEQPYTVPDRSFTANVGDTLAVIALTESLKPQFDASPGVNRTRAVGTERLRLDRIEMNAETGLPREMRLTRTRDMTRDGTNVSASYLVTPGGGRNFTEAGFATTTPSHAAAYGAGGPLDDDVRTVFLEADPETGAFPDLRLGHVVLSFDTATINGVRYRIDP